MAECCTETTYDTTNPLEAGIGWTVKLDKGDFVGRDALVRAKEQGLARRLARLEAEGRRVPRHGMAVESAGRPVGHVTSGTFSPTLDRPIAMALVKTPLAREGMSLAVDLRGRDVAVKVEALPFYSRKRKKKTPGG